MKRTVLMVERGKHPRFAIGESSTPFANLLLEKLAEDFDFPFLRELSEWGSWQNKHPGIASGLKRGFTFFHHRFGERMNFDDRSTQLLVAASPNDTVADTHWYRPEFDEFHVRKAQELGVDYMDETRIDSISASGGQWRIGLSRNGIGREVVADFLIDASGSNSILAEYFQIPREAFPLMPKTAGVWAHFRDVKRMDDFAKEGRAGVPPYPIDDAAVHHVFEGGWIWMLRFNNGITSAGAVFRTNCEFVAATAEGTWQNLLNGLPAVKELFEGSSKLTPTYSSQEISFRRGRIAGKNWAMLPSAAGFVDPLLSTGFALNLLGIDRLATAIREMEFQAKGFEQQTMAELEAVADLVSALYAKMNSPEEFNLLTLLYFAALSFTETAWRLGKREIASGFLLSNLKGFSRELAVMCDHAREGKAVTREAIGNVIQPFDIAGLTDWSRRNWYPVDMRDLMCNAEKLQASREDLHVLFRKLKLRVPQ
jgi:FADH2 O2-dependent halogenase